MRIALIGNGTIGKTLSETYKFSEVYTRKNIAHIEASSCDTFIIAAPGAEKWKANRMPGTDYGNIASLIGHLKKIDRKHNARIILFSTIDAHEPYCFRHHYNANWYGLHRQHFENQMLRYFPKQLTILRLPALVGPNICKNAIFDLKHNKPLTVTLNSHFQFFNLCPVNLWTWIERFLAGERQPDECKLFHLVSPPISLQEIIDHCELAPQVCNDATTINYNVPHKFGSRAYSSTKKSALKAISNYLKDL